MTILPPFKKKHQHRERPDARQNVGPSGEHLARNPVSGALQLQPCGPPVGMRLMKKSPRPADIRSQPPAKRAMYQPGGLTSPLSSPRGGSTSLDEHLQHDPSTTGVSSTNDDDCSGNNNNSDDEYELEYARDDQMEKEFAERLEARGLVIKEMEGDGACMFRAIAEQIYGDQEMHGQIRNLCMNYMENNRDYYCDFLTEDFDQYIARKRLSNVHGNHLELQAISEMFARPVEVYQYSDEPINILLPRDANPVGGNGAAETGEPVSAAPAQSHVGPNAPLRLSYHGAVHYNAIVDPQAATVGVGLGLPGLVPGAADEALLADAVVDSERSHIEETMLKDKLNMSDWQRTEADIEEQVARESYMDYVRSVEQQRHMQRSPKKFELGAESPSKKKELEKTLSSTADSQPPTSSKDKEKEPADVQPSTSNARGAGLYEELLAAQSLDWEAYDEDVSMAEALLLSRQEFVAKCDDRGGSSSQQK